MPFSTTGSQSHSWWQDILQDLRPAPGRLNSSLRITLASIIVVIAMMTLRMPFIAYGLYVIFIVGRASPAVSLRTGIALASAVSCALSISLSVVILTDNSPMARVLSVAAMTFAAGMITVASSIPTLGSGWGLIFCVGIGFWENRVPADTLVKNSLWLLAALLTGIGTAIAVEYVFASRSAAQKLALDLRMRYSALEAMFRAYAGNVPAQQRRAAAERISQLAAAGYLQMLELHTQIVDRDLDRGDLPPGVEAHITMLAELLDNSAAFGLQATSVDAETQSRCELIARRCGKLAREFRTDEPANPSAATGAEFTHLDRVESILGWIEAIETGSTADRSALVALPSRQVPFLIPGAISKRENVAFSLKISLAATICYILYHAIDWPGISTSVITVMVAGLLHTGAMKQRLLLRLLGTTIGGLALGIGAQIFLFPFMDSITSLVVVIGGIAFFSAWVAAGSRFGYLGIQIAFAFYLTALVGFSAPTELGTARDRFVGVLLGVVVMWFVLDQIWPVRTITVMRRAVASALRDAHRVIGLVDSGMPPANRVQESNFLRDRLGKQLTTLRMLNEATKFEFGADHEKSMQAGDTFMRLSMTAIALVWNHAAVLHRQSENNTVSDPALVVLRQAIAQRLRSLADGLSQEQSADAAKLADTLNWERFQPDQQSEYSRNLIARYNELQALASSLRLIP